MTNEKPACCDERHRDVTDIDVMAAFNRVAAGACLFFNLQQEVATMLLKIRFGSTPGHLIAATPFDTDVSQLLVKATRDQLPDLLTAALGPRYGASNTSTGVVTQANHVEAARGGKKHLGVFVGVHTRHNSWGMVLPAMGPDGARVIVPQPLDLEANLLRNSQFGMVFRRDIH